jgi:hypothetical protein
MGKLRKRALADVALVVKVVLVLSRSVRDLAAEIKPYRV